MVRGPTDEEYARFSKGQKRAYWGSVIVISVIIVALIIKKLLINYE
jgi:hypothetical protein